MMHSISEPSNLNRDEGTTKDQGTTHPDQSASTFDNSDGVHYLHGVGAIFQYSKQHSWPKNLELTDDEGASERHSLEIKPTFDPSSLMSSNGNDQLHASTPTQGLTPTHHGPYLPEAEIPELMRQLSKKRKRDSSNGMS
jgi:hypothetical protein